MNSLEYNINKINPFCIYTVGDLYNLYRRGRNLHLINYHEDLGSRLKNFDMESFYKKPLIHCDERELKFAILLLLSRICIKSIFDKGQVPARNLRTCYDGLTVINCFLANLGVKPTSYSQKIDVLDYKDPLSKIYSLGNLEILDIYNVSDSPEKFWCIDHYESTKLMNSINAKNKRRYQKGLPYLDYPKGSRRFGGDVTNFNRFGSELYLLSSSGTYRLRRPFRDPQEYPIIDYKPAVSRLRDIIYSWDQNQCSGWLRKPAKKMEAMEMSEKHFLEFLLKPCVEINEEDIILSKKLLDVYPSQSRYKDIFDRNIFSLMRYINKQDKIFSLNVKTRLTSKNARI